MSCKILPLLSCVLFSFTINSVFAESKAGKTERYFDETVMTDENSPDIVQHSKGRKGYFWNLGPTGIRAKLTDIDGKIKAGGQGIQFIVQYVFPKSPAYKKIKVDDVIVGVNGKRFEKEYTIGYFSAIGFEGPITELGDAIEDSDKNHKGKVSFMVKRGGKDKEVVVRIKSLGGFSDTFPENCKKSKTMKSMITKYILSRQKASGDFPGHAHSGFMCALYLMAQGKKYTKQVEKYLDHISKGIIENSGSWQLAMNGIAFSEYYHLTRKKKYFKSMQKVDKMLKSFQRKYKNGTFGHRGTNAPLGYGPMCASTLMVALSWSMMDKAKLPIHKKGLTRILNELDLILGRSYGWANHGGQTLALDEKRIVQLLDEIPDDIRPLDEKKRGGCITQGLMSLVHAIRPWQDYSEKMVFKNVNVLGRGRRVLINGHGSGLLHAWAGWTALGMSANRGWSAPYRLALEQNKALLNSSWCHDGTFYAQPQRDITGNDYGRGSRILPTALWGLVLSIPDQGLKLFGKGFKATPGLSDYKKAEKYWHKHKPNSSSSNRSKGWTALQKAKEKGSKDAAFMESVYQQEAKDDLERIKKEIAELDIKKKTKALKNYIKAYGEILAEEASQELEKLESSN